MTTSSLGELPATGAGSTLLLVLGLWLVAGGVCSLAMGWALRSLNAAAVPTEEERRDGRETGGAQLDADQSILQHHWSAWTDDEEAQ